jgi:hypothetical protein
MDATIAMPDVLYPLPVERRRVSPQVDWAGAVSSMTGSPLDWGLRTGAYVRQPADGRTRSGKDITGPKTVELLASRWAGGGSEGWHQQWGCGQVLLAFPRDGKTDFYKEQADKDPLRTDLICIKPRPASCVSCVGTGPGALLRYTPTRVAAADHAPDPSAGASDAGQPPVQSTAQQAAGTSQPTKEGDGAKPLTLTLYSTDTRSAVVTVAQLNALLSAANEKSPYLRAPSLVGVCVDAPEQTYRDDTARVCVAVVGTATCANYWGSSLRPGTSVGFILATGADEKKNEMMITPWRSDASRVPSAGYFGDKRQFWYYSVGIIVRPEQLGPVSGQTMRGTIGTTPLPPRNDGVYAAAGAEDDAVTRELWRVGFYTKDRLVHTARSHSDFAVTRDTVTVYLQPGRYSFNPKPATAGTGTDPSTRAASSVSALATKTPDQQPTVAQIQKQAPAPSSNKTPEQQGSLPPPTSLSKNNPPAAPSQSLTSAPAPATQPPTSSPLQSKPTGKSPLVAQPAPTPSPPSTTSPLRSPTQPAQVAPKTSVNQQGDGSGTSQNSSAVAGV